MPYFKRKFPYQQINEKIESYDLAIATLNRFIRTNKSNKEVIEKLIKHRNQLVELRDKLDFSDTFPAYVKMRHRPQKIKVGNKSIVI